MFIGLSKSILPVSKRIILYFVLGIVLPCILLGYFAFRGIRNDRALLEKQMQSDYQNLLLKTTTSIDNELEGIEQMARSMLIRLIAGELSDIDTLDINCIPVCSYFILDGSGKIEVLYPRLLYKNDEITPSVSPAITSSNPLYAKAENFEFRVKNFDKAIQIYQTLLKSETSPSCQGHILIAMARLQRKSGDTVQAARIYQTLLEHHYYDNGVEGISLGLTASVELGNILCALGDTLAAAKILFNAYQNLLSGKMNCTRSAFHFFQKILKNTLQQILNIKHHSNSFGNLMQAFRTVAETESLKIAITDELTLFQAMDGRPIFERLAHEINTRSLRLKIGQQNYLMDVWKTTLTNNGEAYSYYGILLNESVVLNKIIVPALDSLASGTNINWRILSFDGEIIEQGENFTPGKLLTAIHFVNNFPPWNLEIYQKDPNMFENLLLMRRSINFYSFILIAGILGVGLIMVLVIVSREMEYAKLRSDLASTISHELRSPLTSIRQLAEMLQRGRVPTQRQKQKYYDVIVEQSEKLSLLINNILDFASFEEGRRKFYFETVDPGKFLQNILDEFVKRVKPEDFQVTIDIEPNMPPLTIDRIAIHQAVLNLLDNAVKYSADVKEIIFKAYTDGNHVAISVADFGIGIAHDEQKKIFDRFYRGKNESIRYRVKGSGLGLSLVKLITRAHHGTISVSSDPGKGSTFTIKIPF